MSAATLSLPSTEAGPVRTAAAGLLDLIEKVGPDTVAGLILMHAQRELASLSRTNSSCGTVSGPHRLKAVA